MGLPHVALRPFGRAEDLELEFGGGDRPGLVTDLLARCSDSQSTQFWWTQTVGIRVGALLRLLALTESADSLPVQARCTEPACAETFEIELPLAALVDQAQGSVPLRVVLPDKRTVSLRRPTGEDLRNWHGARYGSRREAVAAMIGALVVDGPATPADEPVLAEALSAWDPLVAFRVPCQCPVCGVENEVQLDLESIALARLDARQRALLQDVHQLASHYGWTESEVLAIAPARLTQDLSMALADSVGAVGAATQLLQEHLLARMFEVSVGKPEDAAENNTNAKLNLFLYEIGFDPYMRNTSLRDGQPPPLWLVLKYLLTAFDADENSDTAAAHALLGRGVSALHELSFLPLVAPSAIALENNPEPLKLTFDESTVDLISKIMQGTDERYRLSVAFQVRPVMIVPPSAPRSSLLVGIDYTTAPDSIIGEDGIQIDVQPSLGPSLDRVEPQRFEAGAQITLFGNDLNSADLEAVLGDVVLTINERHPDRLVVTAEGDPGGPISAGTALSAGEIPLIVRRSLPSNRTRSSNLLAARLLPTLSTAAIVAGDLVLTGFLLGDEADDVVVSFYRDDGVTVQSIDTVVAVPDQQTLTVTGAAAAVPGGSYRVILQVNNQQARSSPSVTVP